MKEYNDRQNFNYFKHIICKKYNMEYVLTLILILSTVNFNSAQNIEFGEVDKSELLKTSYNIDTSAVAIRLFLNRTTSFDYDISDGWILVTDIHERIKILDKDGLDYATKKIALFKKNSTRETVRELKAYTYNINGNKISKEKLRRNAVFKENQSDNWTLESFTMPDVKVGSIIEWSYKLISPFWKIDDLIIQKDIPTLHYYAKIQAHEYFKYNRMVKGGHTIIPKDYYTRRKLKISYEGKEDASLHQATGLYSKEVLASRTKDVLKSGTIAFQEFVSEYNLNNIPALKEESFVSNIENYRFLVSYELNTVQFPNVETKYYSNTWEEVVKSIYESDEFGEQLKKTNFLKAEVEKIKSTSSGESQIIAKVFSHIKNKMNWNGNFGKYTELGLQKAYKESIGNVSDVNLLLVALLKKCGIKANPVLVSTRNHGIPLYPTLEGFNYVIACAEVGGKIVLLDATDKLSYPNVLPQRVLNWEGTLVLEDGRFRKINLYPKKASQHNTIMSMTINNDGSLIGKQTSSYTDLAAMAYRKKVRGYSNDEYIDALINDYTFDDLVDFESKNKEDLSKSVMESYSFEFDQGVDVVGNEMYFSPLFFYKLSENPFKLEDRTYPVNFTYPSSRKKIINVKIPVGYQVTSTPKPIKMSLPDGMGSFLFNISVVEGGLNVMSTFKINTAIIPAHRYAELKEFYNQRVLKETEKVVLTKM